MDTTALRQKLLDLAIRGRLVPQNPDEPAVELDAEDIVPESEQSFEIPKNWRWTKLGHIGDWRSGSTPKRNILAYYENGNIPWLKTGDLTDGIVSSIPECITEKAFSESSMRLNPKGSVLIAMYGATIGKLGILDIESTTNQACCACIADNNLIINWFLFYYLLSQRKEFIALGAGGAQPNISRQKIISYPIPLPPLEEQKRIVAKLEQLFEVINRCEEAQKQIADTATQLRSSLLQAAIQGRLVPQNPDEPAVELDAKDTVPESEQPFEIPENWRWSNFSGIASLISGRDLNTNQILASGQLPYITGASQIANEKLIASRWTNNPYTLSELNDAILVCKGSGVGKVAINNIGLVHIARQIMAIRAKTNKIIPSFLFLYIKAHSKIFTDKAQGLIPGISRKDVLSINIPIPPLQEQERIAAKLERLFAAIDTIQQAAI